MRLRLPATATVSIAVLLVSAAPAAAGVVRYAGPGSSDTTGNCADPAAPCEIEHAIEHAAASDEVIVLPGRYEIGTASIAPVNSVTVRGLDTANRPTIVSAPPPLGGSVLEVDAAGAVLRDLRVESNSSATAIALQGGSTGERLIGIVSGGSGDAKGIQLKNSTNVLRDSIAASDAPSGAGLQIKDGTNTAIGVTAAGSNGANGASTKIISGSAVIKNSILTGNLDLDVDQGLSPTVSYSNWRQENSIGGTDGFNNHTDAPRFCHTRGLYYPASGGSWVNAGGVDLAAGDFDVIGQSRTLLGNRDIGAYEYDNGGCPQPPVTGGPDQNGQNSTNNSGTSGSDSTGSGDGGGQGTSVLPPKSNPVLGTSVTLSDVKGAPRVRLPGSDTFVPLTADSTVPVGAVVDATKGTVELTSVRDASGKTQTGAFWGGVFQVRQGKSDTVTELALTGSNFGACKGKRSTRGKLNTAGRRHSAAVRRLWGRDRGGRFRTRGRHGSATVRGTRWLTEDRCEGTLFKVTEGAIDVRDTAKRKTVRVKRGASYLARPHDPKRKRGRGR